jgi:hypothetical protein
MLTMTPVTWKNGRARKVGTAEVEGVRLRAVLVQTGYGWSWEAWRGLDECLGRGQTLTEAGSRNAALAALGLEGAE